jgi:hypothetical protein|tara:strand:- start:1318 stop:1497 length:180 start_codon:yes stop_codon:yes gene_type:complete
MTKHPMLKKLRRLNPTPEDETQDNWDHSLILWYKAFVGEGYYKAFPKAVLKANPNFRID